MGESNARMRIAPWLVAAVVLLVWPAGSSGQVSSPGVTPGPFIPGRVVAPIPPNPEAAAPEDLTGYWVSLVTEDWRYRMLTAPVGDFQAVPLSEAGKKLAEAWNPAADEASGNQCKAYGAAGLMRMPGRLHITWADPSTLRIDFDAGTQTRLFHFDGKPPAAGPPEWQGYTAANWVLLGNGREAPQGGYLKAETTRMKPGYLRKNGVPYSATATMTEYFTRTTEPSGVSYLFVTTVVLDPVYLSSPFVTSTHFKKLADDSGWRPTPCKAR